MESKEIIKPIEKVEKQLKDVNKLLQVLIHIEKQNNVLLNKLEKKKWQVLTQEQEQ